MPRYVRAFREVHPNDTDWSKPASVPSITIHYPEVANTGLLYPDGQPIMRAPDPIGFVPLKER